MSDRSPAIFLDARLSPALAMSPELLRIEPRHRKWGGAPARLLIYDETLRWLTTSDRIVSDQAARALLEVKQSRLHVKEGHARWSTYLRAFVPMTARWCQQEMRRAGALREFPGLAAAWAAGALSKSHLRVILRAVTRETEDAWLQRASGATVRELEDLAAREREAADNVGCAPGTTTAAREDGGAMAADPEEARSTRRVVMVPPGVGVLVSEAVDVARKMAGYQIGIGAAVEMMAMEMAAGLNECSLSSEPRETQASDRPSTSALDGSDSHAAGPARKECPEDMRRESRNHASTARRRYPGPTLGDHVDLRRELGIGWELIHQQMEAATGRWRDLPSDLREVLIHGAPAEDASAHERVVFWTGLQGRLDAVRGRLLRIMDESYQPSALGFAGFGQYVRERMGLSLRDAHELVRLDRALERLPVAFRMYASGRLGRRAAWLLSRVATSRTDRAWTRFAMTHTLRLLEVVVEGALLKREVDPPGWERDGGLPPQDATFAGALRACSLLKGFAPGGDATARVEFLLDPEQLACYEATLERLREVVARDHTVGGGDRPEWWGLAVMARYFLNCYRDEDRLASPARLRRMFHRRIIQRDNYTCRAPECLQRGGLEADHMVFRSRGGPTTNGNMVSLCAADHRFMKHTARTLSLSGEAPDRISVKMGSRAYFNDNLIEPALNEAVLDEDPWRSSTRHVAAVSRSEGLRLQVRQSGRDRSGVAGSSAAAG